MIRALDLQNFRNYEKVSLRFEEKLNFFVGENASGKTNLLEALGYVSFGRSFRGVSDSALIREGASNFFLRCELINRHNDGVRVEIGVEATPSPRKKVKKDGRILRRMSDLIGSMIAVVFTPEDLAIVQGSHQERRSFIDFILGSMDPDYLEALLQYNRALRQRNELLRRIRENRARLEELVPWDEIFLRNGITVQGKRRSFLSGFEGEVCKSVERISNLGDRVSLRLDSPDEQEFRNRLKERRFEEVQAGHSLVGPHRDHLHFLDSSGRDIATRFSQGQKRTLALALRVAQFYYVKAQIGCPPVLLIDDVLHELDIHRRRAFLELLEDCGQAFFTTPDIRTDSDVFRSFASSRVFQVRGGRVVSE